ncbi:MAG: GntR family transcriptional regulator [Thermodesulfovibrionales bacterium]
METQAIDRESQEKLYVQVSNILRAKIEKGHWPNGAQVPTEDDLCRTYRVSKSTVRLAVAELQRLGYLLRRQGKGTFVTYCPANPGMAVRTVLTDGMFGEGVEAQKEAMASGLVEPPLDVRLHLGTDGPVYYVLIKRTANGAARVLDETFIMPGAVRDLEGLDLTRGSIFEVLDRHCPGRVRRVKQSIELSEIRRPAAAELGLREGDPVLLLHRLITGGDGRPIAYSRLYGPRGKYKIQTEFERIR